jgi:hypothetical protein
MPPIDESKLTNVERWSVLADRIDEHRRETEDRRRRRDQQELVPARRHLRLVPPGDDTRSHW